MEEAVEQLNLIRLPAVIQKVGLSCSSIYDLMAKGKFPRSVPITSGSVGWVESEVNGFIKERIEQRNKRGAK